MEDTAMQHWFTFIILDKIILQNKKQARWRRRKMWQVKEMEEVYGVADFMILLDGLDLLFLIAVNLM